MQPLMHGFELITELTPEVAADRVIGLLQSERGRHRNVRDRTLVFDFGSRSQLMIWGDWGRNPPRYLPFEVRIDVVGCDIGTVVKASMVSTEGPVAFRTAGLTEHFRQRFLSIETALRQTLGLPTPVTVIETAESATALVIAVLLAGITAGLLLASGSIVWDWRSGIASASVDDILGLAAIRLLVGVVAGLLVAGAIAVLWRFLGTHGQVKQAVINLWLAVLGGVVVATAAVPLFPAELVLLPYLVPLLLAGAVALALARRGAWPKHRP